MNFPLNIYRSPVFGCFTLQTITFQLNCSTVNVKRFYESIYTQSQHKRFDLARNSSNEWRKRREKCSHEEFPERPKLRVTSSLSCVDGKKFVVGLRFQ